MFDLGFDRTDYLLGELGLGIDNIPWLADDVLGPDLSIGDGVGELDLDANALADGAQRALDDVAHAERLADIPGIVRPLIEPERRAASHDEEPPGTGNLGNHVVREPVRQHGVPGDTLPRPEREHHDRWPARQ